MKDFKCHVIGDENFPVKHGKPRPAGKRYHEMLADMKPMNEDYFCRKWGAIGENPTFEKPFNKPNNRINEWTIEAMNRLKRVQIWDKFWNNSPLLYE